MEKWSNNMSKICFLQGFKNSGKEREGFNENFLQFLKKTKLKQKQSRIWLLEIVIFIYVKKE